MTPQASRTGRRVLLAAFLAALAFTGFHVFRTARDAIYWHQHRDEPIEGWMNVGFVAHSYHVPPHVLLKAIGLPPGPPPDKRPLRIIADAQGRSLDQLKGALIDAIIHVRPPYPPPSPPPQHAR